MAISSHFADTGLPIRDAFIVSGDYIVDPTKVVAVSSVYPCAETMTRKFTVLLAGGHELDLCAEVKATPGTWTIDRELHEKDTNKLREDFLCQWRCLTNRLRRPS